MCEGPIRWEHIVDVKERDNVAGTASKAGLTDDCLYLYNWTSMTVGLAKKVFSVDVLSAGISYMEETLRVRCPEPKLEDIKVDHANFFYPEEDEPHGLVNGRLL